MPHPFARPRSDQELAERPHGIAHPAPKVLPGGTPAANVGELHGHLSESRAALERISKLLARKQGPEVLETATITIPGITGPGPFEPGAPGVFTQDRYRIPYNAIAILNPTAAVLVVSSGPAQSSAPGGGQGQHIVPANCFLAFNMTGSSLTIYGTAGSTISYTVFADGIQPAAGKIA